MDLVGHRSKKKTVGLVFGPILFFTMLLIPFPNSTVSEDSPLPLGKDRLYFDITPEIAMGTMLWMIVWGITECVPLGFTS